jgi:phosphoglucomutase
MVFKFILKKVLEERGISELLRISIVCKKWRSITKKMLQKNEDIEFAINAKITSLYKKYNVMRVSTQNTKEEIYERRLAKEIKKIKQYINSFTSIIGIEFVSKVDIKILFEFLKKTFPRELFCYDIFEHDNISNVTEEYWIQRSKEILARVLDDHDEKMAKIAHKIEYWIHQYSVYEKCKKLGTKKRMSPYTPRFVPMTTTFDLSSSPNLILST